MIFFCEDCGEKNKLSLEHVITGKAVFRCRSCKYLNAYPVKGGQEMIRKELDSFSMRLKRVPEIIGSFLFHKNKGVLKNNMPDFFKKTDLTILGKLLTKNFYYSRSQYPDIHQMALILSNKTIFVQMVGNDLAVIIASKTFPLSKPIINELGCLVSNGTA